MSCMKNHLYGKLSLHTRELLYGMLLQATMPRIKLREYRSSVHNPPQKCTQLNGRMHMRMWCEIVSPSSDCATCTVFVSVVHKNMSYDGVQVYIRNNASVCTNA